MILYVYLEHLFGKKEERGLKLNRVMGKLISIVRGSREMKGFRKDSLSIYGAFI